MPIEFNRSVQVAKFLDPAKGFEPKFVPEYDPEARYCSINWNYMPPSASSLVHPHLQVFAGDSPTPYQEELLEASRRYWDEQGLYSFNLSIYSGIIGESCFWTHARITPRYQFPPLSASDIGSLSILHDQFFSLKLPETACKELKGYF